jgi:hypothetical protein
MAETKTKPTDVPVESFLADIIDEKARADCYKLVNLMEKVTGEKPVMWGPSIVGFGKYRYQYGSGHSGEMCLTGFSPRKGNLSLYCLSGCPGQNDILKQLGKHKAGKGCLYIKTLDDVNLDILEQLISKSAEFMKKIFPD